MNDTEKLAKLKKVALAVYFCQVLCFLLAGFPLFIGVVLNFMYKKAAQGTWIESHFEWQIKTAWVALAGFAIAGLTFELGIGIFILIATVVMLVYRIVLGWNAINVDKAINPKNYN